MQLHFIIHAPFEKPGTIQAWADEQGHEYTYTHTYLGEALPVVQAFDFLVVMGGPQSPLHMNKYPYLHTEITLIKQAVAENKYIVGVCLGAQLLAQALGAKPEHSPEKEVGMFPINLTTAGKSDRIFKQLPTTFDVMHWHYDMPGIPKDAEVLASSAGCPRQVFRWGDRCYGLQCHLELTRDTTQGLIDRCSADLEPGRYTQSAATMLQADFATLSRHMKLFLNQLVS